MSARSSRLNGTAAFIAEQMVTCLHRPTRRLQGRWYRQTKRVWQRFFGGDQRRGGLGDERPSVRRADYLNPKEGAF